MTEPTKEEAERFILEQGWQTYYNDNYWVHAKTVADPKSQDYTNYGMSALDAYHYETEKYPPVKQRYGIPILNIAATLRESIDHGQHRPRAWRRIATWCGRLARRAAAWWR